MNIIGVFTWTGSTYEGRILTLSVQSTGVQIMPTDKPLRQGATHAVRIGDAIVGEGWPASPEPGSDLTLVLDDPSFASEIRAQLTSQGGDEYHLIWQR